MKKLAITCALLSGMVVSQVWADAASDLKSRLDKVSSFHASFTQKVTDGSGNAVQDGQGDLWVKRPESPLSNLLADILVWSSAKFDEQPDFAIYNVGGIRAALSKGAVTRGNILDVAPFENKICFLTLSGNDVLELFAQIAMRHGEGLSHSLRLTATADGKLVSATVNGKPVDPNAKYRVATLDYLAQGNDHMEAFRKKTDVVSPTGEENNVRFLIEQYFKAANAKGEAVSRTVEGRMTIVEK